MAEKIKLSKPIMINGKNISEFTYDIDAISAEQLLEADARASTGLAAQGIQNMNLAEFNTSLHFYLGCFAVIAQNPEIDIEDMKRVGGRDTNKIRKIGQTFFSDTAEDEDQEKDSILKQPEDSSEAIAESTTKAPKN